MKNVRFLIKQLLIIFALLLIIFSVADLRSYEQRRNRKDAELSSINFAIPKITLISEAEASAATMSMQTSISSMQTVIRNSKNIKCKDKE